MLTRRVRGARVRALYVDTSGGGGENHREGRRRGILEPRRLCNAKHTLNGEDGLMSVSSVAEKWVDEAAALTKPDRTVWCDGSKAEYDRLIEDMLRDGTLLPLNQRTYPNCYL